MNYSLIYTFLNKHFQEIESAVLFGSYIDNPSKANDIVNKYKNDEDEERFKCKICGH